MTTLDQITKAALQLPDTARAELADLLVQSLDAGLSNEIQELWTRVAIMRRDEVRSGQVQPLQGEDVLAEARHLASR